MGPDLLNTGDDEMTQSRTSTKPEQILKLIRSRHGAGISKLCQQTGWQPHSVRAAISRLRKEGHAIDLVASRTAGKENRYKLTKTPGCVS
ncbi:MAG: hypothetical protein C0605_15990 [Hyphomicrobiales bacterium]|nr:MAG: hypothetical protein C0605_15990 [Hyphomicrobiales bacterium]